MLNKLIKLYWQICRLQRSPASTPDSTLLTGMLVFAFVFIKLSIIMVMPQMSGEQVFLMVKKLIITCVSLVGYTYLVLNQTKLLERFVRAINCLLACSIIIEVLSIPVLLMMPNPPADGSTPVAGPVLVAQLTAFFMLFVFAIWQIVVSVYIYQQSLSISQGRAFLVWLGLIATQMVLLLIGGLI